MIGTIPANDFKKQSNSGFNFREMLSRYIKYLPFIILALFLGLILGYIKIRYATPVYQIKSSLLIKDENKYGSSDNNKFMDLFLSGGDQNVNNEQEILKSRPLIGRVVNSLNLQTAYYNKGRIRTSLLFREIPFRLQIIQLNDSSRNFMISVNTKGENAFSLNQTKDEYNYSREFTNEFGRFKLIRDVSIPLKIFSSNEFTVAYNSFASAVELIVSDIKVLRTQDFANILDITLQSENTALGIAIVDNLMKEYAISNIEDKNKIAVNTLRFIDERMDSLGNELGGVENTLQSYREKNQAIDLGQQSGLYFENLKETDNLIQTQSVNLKILEYLINYIQNTANIYKIVPSNLGIEEPTLIPLFKEYNEKILARESFLQNTPEQNVIIKDLNIQISKLRVDILENLKNVRQAYLIAKADLDRRFRGLKSQVQGVPGKAKGLLEITRQQKIKEELFLFLLQKKEETAISSASTISSSRVVEPAIASPLPVSPNRTPIYLSYGLIALAIALSAIVVIELLNDKVNDKKDVERLTNAPILGQVGHSSLQDNSLVITKNSRSIIAEQFRILRTSLQYILKDTKHPVILVSSTFSGEGKSFITTNLAAAIALTGKRTVVLEFDIRKPKILAGLNLKNTLGLTNYLVGNASLTEIVATVNEIDNLYVIPCGPIPPNPAELLLDEKIETVFEYCKKNFDIIIVDSAPSGLVSDAMVLSRYSNCCLFIIRQKYTYLKQLEFVEELYQSKKLQQLALIINDVTTDSGHYGYGYGGYGYGYNGYYDNNNQKTFVERIKRFFYKSKNV